MAVNIHITIIELNALHTKRQNLFQKLDAVIHLLMEAKHWGLRKSRNATSFFFSSRRRHTRSKRDWSSDVCSSDLSVFARPQHARAGMNRNTLNVSDADRENLGEIGRASCRERVYGWVVVGIEKEKK